MSILGSGLSGPSGKEIQEKPLSLPEFSDLYRLFNTRTRKDLKYEILYRAMTTCLSETSSMKCYQWPPRRLTVKNGKETVIVHGYRVDWPASQTLTVRISFQTVGVLSLNTLSAFSFCCVTLHLHLLNASTSRTHFVRYSRLFTLGMEQLCDVL